MKNSYFLLLSLVLITALLNLTIPRATKEIQDNGLKRRLEKLHYFSFFITVCLCIIWFVVEI